MNQRLRALSIFCLLALLSPADAQIAGPDTSASNSAPGASLIDGRVLISRARQTLARQASIEAKIRQQIDLFGQQLVGNGVYLQQGTGTERLVRLELKIQTANQISSLLQVADRRYLWTERRLQNLRTVSQVDLRKVRVVWKQQRESGVSQPTAGLLVGGLSELLAGIAENFDFSSVQETTLSDVPVYKLSGQLSQQALAGMLPKKKKKDDQGTPPSLDQLPPQVPHQVILMLGRDDLFPYVVDFRRRDEEQGNSDANTGKTIVRMQLFEVRTGGTIDPRRFVYKPGAIDVTDGTSKFLQTWRRRETLNR